MLLVNFYGHVLVQSTQKLLDEIVYYNTIHTVYNLHEHDTYLDDRGIITCNLTGNLKI